MTSINDDDLFEEYCKFCNYSLEKGKKIRETIISGVHYQKFVLNVRSKELSENIREEFKRVLSRRFKWVVAISKEVRKCQKN